MTPFQPSDEFKDMFLDASAEDFDVKNRVLQKLHERKKLKEAFQMKKKVSLIVAACLVFGVTSAYAAIKVYEIKNERGEVVVKVEQTENGQKQERTMYEKIAAVRESLPPGTTAAVYIVGKDNPDKSIQYVQIPRIITDHGALQSEVGNFDTIPAELDGGYKFQEGSVDHPVNYSQKGLAEDMYAEAERMKQDVVVRKLENEPNIQRLNARYAGSKGNVRIVVENFENMKYTSSEAGPDEKVETVTVQHKEGLYHVLKLKDGKEVKTVQFYRDDTKRLVEVSTLSADISKQDLLNIAERLK